MYDQVHSNVKRIFPFSKYSEEFGLINFKKAFKFFNLYWINHTTIIFFPISNQNQTI